MSFSCFKPNSISAAKQFRVLISKFDICSAFNVGTVRYKKMFGEYMVYVNENPILLFCDNIVFVKILPCLDSLMVNAEKGYSYNGAKEYYVLDIDDVKMVREVILALEPVIDIPKPRKRKKEVTNG